MLKHNHLVENLKNKWVDSDELYNHIFEYDNSI
jgi:hypothetical protein